MIFKITAEGLLERVEDAEDLKWLRERRKQPVQFRSFDAFVAENQARV